MFDFNDSIVSSFSTSFINDLRNKKFKIIVSSISEPTSYISILEKQLKLFFEQYDLAPDCFSFIDSNRDIVELNKKFGKTIFYYTPHFIYDGADSFVDIVNSVNYKNDLNYNSEILTKSEILKNEDSVGGNLYPLIYDDLYTYIKVKVSPFTAAQIYRFADKERKLLLSSSFEIFSRLEKEEAIVACGSD